MRKRIIPLIAAAALTVSLTGAVSAVENEDWRPPCADITSGGGVTSLNTTTGSYDVSVNLQTAGRCGGVTYTLYVYDTLADCESGANLLTTLSTRGTNALGQAVIAGDSGDTDEFVYVYATSSLGGKTLDRAPDTGCIELSTFPPAGQFN